MDLVSSEQFADYLRRDSPTLAAGEQMLLTGACDAVREYCGWHIAPVLTETVTVDGSGIAVQTLPTLNLLSVNSVLELGVALDATRVDFSANGIMEKRTGSPWTSRRRGIVAGITHGYPQTPGWVLTLICASAGRALPTGDRVVSQESSGGESVTYAVPRPAAANEAPAGAVVLLAVEMRMLDRIRIPGPA